jgi:hypothetical protein
VTSQLVAQRLTAAMIAALDITTSRLTVTSGAKIGNFSIENGWLKSTAAAGQDAGYIDMRNGDSRVAFGSDLIPAVSGGGLTLSALIHNRKKAAAGGVTCALELRSSGDTNSTKAIALNARGGVVIKGSTSFVEEIAPLNMSTSDSSGSTAGVLLYYRCFAFQSSVSGYAADIFLPSDSAIDDAFGYFETGYSAVDHAFITVKMLVTRFSSGYYHVKSPASSTPLIDRDGNTVSSVKLEKGDFAEFTYCNRAWYLSAKN